MKCYDYKGVGLIGCDNNGLINPLKATTCSNRDNTGLGFKKVPFHLGINKFVLEPKCSVEYKSWEDFDVLEDSDDGEDLYPYPIPHNLAKFFAKLDDFVLWFNSITSDTSEDTTNAYRTQKM